MKAHTYFGIILLLVKTCVGGDFEKIAKEREGIHLPDISLYRTMWVSYVPGRFLEIASILKRYAYISLYLLTDV